MIPFFPLYTNADMYNVQAYFWQFRIFLYITIDSEADNSKDNDSEDVDSGSSPKM